MQFSPQRRGDAEESLLIFKPLRLSVSAMKGYGGIFSHLPSRGVGKTIQKPGGDQASLPFGLNRDQLDLKDKCSVGPNVRACATVAIGKGRGNKQLPL